MSSDMNAEPNTVRDDFADRLASFDDKLHATSDDVDMLSEIQSGIGELLKTPGVSEAQIRKILQERYEAGALRKETYQLVKSMLDHYISETIPTSPTSKTIQAAQARLAVKAQSKPEPKAEPAKDSFRTTTIIPVELVPKAATEPAGESHVQVGSVLRDRFVLQEEIAGGSMGVVFKAMDRRLAEAGSKDHWVAIKVLSPQLAENGQALRALQQEAAKGRCLIHPNIVRFIDLDREDDLYFLIMEWLEGRTLAEILDSKDANIIDATAAFRIVRQIGEALDYAHRCGIVHADIKPGNIMIMPNGDAKLFDFGVARVRQQQVESDFDPGVLGAITPAYSSLQVLTGEEPIASDDVFSLSCLFYRLIAGYRVFGPRDAAAASQEGMSPQRLKGLNDDQWRTVKKGLAYARVMRFASVREFLDELGEEVSEPILIDVPDRFDEQDENSSVGRTLLVILLLLAVGMAGAYQLGYLQPLVDKFDTITDDIPVLDTIETSDTDVRDTGLDEAPKAPAPIVVEEPVVEEFEAAVTNLEEMVGPAPKLVDFSKLPSANRVIPFTHGTRSSESFNLAIREDAGDMIIDFVRATGLSEAILLRLEEVGFSGNRSPWVSGKLKMSNSGLIELPAGQVRGRITLSMAADSRREADQQSTLRLRDAEFVNSEIAILNITLEDDDRRAIESQISANTVGLSESQMAVSEADPAVQIELIRFNPNDQPLDVEFTVIDLTAKEGSDFFKPGGHTVLFGPRERTARLLIPLVQDSEVEGDEAFIFGLTGTIDPAPVPVIREVIIMIEDDDLQQ